MLQAASAREDHVVKNCRVHPTHWWLSTQVVGGISLLSLVIQYLQERALPRSVTGAKDPTAPTQSEGGIDRYQLSNAPEVAVTLERHSLSPYRLTLTDGL